VPANIFIRFFPSIFAIYALEYVTCRSTPLTRLRQGLSEIRGRERGKERLEQGSGIARHRTFRFASGGNQNQLMCELEGALGTKLESGMTACNE